MKRDDFAVIFSSRDPTRDGGAPRFDAPNFKGVAETDKQRSQDLRDADDAGLVQLPLSELTRRLPSAPVLPPLQNPAVLPLSALEPEVFERLVAEMISRRDNRGVQFYGRRGQAQFGLDVVETEVSKERAVYQVRRYEVFAAADLRNAVADYAGPPHSQSPDKAGTRPFSPKRFVVVTSAGIDRDTATVEALARLQDEYEGDLTIEAWGAERLSRDLRDAPRLVFAVFGPEWARAFCGFTPSPTPTPAPSPYGLVAPPTEVLGLNAMLGDAESSASEDPGRSIRIVGTVAGELAKAGFPVHAEEMRLRQADLAAAHRLLPQAFDIRFKVGIRRVVRRSEYAIGKLRQDVEATAGAVDEIAVAKASVLGAIADWYEGPSDLSTVVLHLETIGAASSEADPDPALAVLCCLVLEQTPLDGYDADATGDEAADAVLLARLQTLAEGLSSVDPVLRARLRCAVVDARLGGASTPETVEEMYGPIVADAAAGRLLHAKGLCLARAARQHARHGSDDRAESLWRQAVLASSEDGYYGDAQGALLCVQRVRWEAADVAAVAGIEVGGMPNSRTILEGPHDHIRDTLARLHDGRLPDAFGDSRRALHEASVAGILVREDQARKLFAEVLVASDQPQEAVRHLALAGTGKRAEAVARGAPRLAEVLDLLTDDRRSVRAAAIRVVGAQAKLVTDRDVPIVVGQLVEQAEGVWTSRWIDPHPEHEALKALAAFGGHIPSSAVDDIIAMAEPGADQETRVDDEVGAVLVQTFWAVEDRRDDLAQMIGRMLARPTAPTRLWGLVAGIPELARAPLLPIVRERAHLGVKDALEVLLSWDDLEATADAARHVRRRAGALLREEVGVERPMQWIGTAEGEAASGLVDLARSVRAPNTDNELLPDDRPPDDVDRVAAGPIRELVNAVAGHLVAMADDEHRGADARAQCLRALRALVPVLAPSTAGQIVEPLVALHSDPRLTADDDLILGMDVPLSRFRMNGGGRNLAPLALAVAAEAWDQWRDDDESAASAAAPIAVAAASLLYSQDDQHRRLGASALAAVAVNSDKGYFHALLLHPDEHVRAIGVGRAPLPLVPVEAMAGDRSPVVRRRLAQRHSELTGDVQIRLQSDVDASVRWAATRRA
ncbi:hypothetical protein PO878_17170 [Iamia majanohamensis]|uniref:Uncharacterized protein n=1 Tax=Iamia majanohamensis TaxID=467976 RepID=A0AAE9YE71_9ACTN|nr:hypothetical protein [Iamia majanohamensis]WCO66236.1 hypothetical protein PO878_17170 [Iamia majanohamensis]